MERDTKIQHFGEDREAFLGSVAPPIFRTSLFTFPSCEALEAALRGESGRHLYSRLSNPTVRVLERKIAELEGADDAVAFSSGMGAISAVLLSFVSSGDHMICFSRAYGPTLSVCKSVLKRFGVRVSFASPEELASPAGLFEERTKLCYLECPASITFEVIDLARVTEEARKRGVVTAVDNSWGTPVFCRPLEFGADLVLHSGTKYLSGHSDVLFGVVAGKQPHFGRVAKLAVLLGACLSPEDAFLALRGLRTLPLRMQRHEQSALTLARRLLLEDRVIEVLHPALPFFRSHALWQRQFSGSSGLFSFRLRGDTKRFANALKVFKIGFSWGGFESLVLPQAVLSALRPRDEVRPDIPPDLVRISVGLEDPEDLWEDLRRGLAAL